MTIEWVDVLTYCGLKDAKVVAGINGLNRQIRYISVYDCEQPSDFEIDESGVLYISSMGQFKSNPQAILPWLKSLNEHRVSGLCTISDAVEILSDEVINYCNENAFPIISVNRDLPYTEIIDSVSLLLHFNNLHIINEKRLERILSTKLSEDEIRKEIRAVNPNLKNRIVVLAISGNFESAVFMKRMSSLFNNQKENSYVQYKGNHFFILSSDDDAGLAKKAASILSLIKPYYVNPQFGESKKYHLIEIDKAINNAQKALYMAQAGNHDYVVYDDFSDISLLYSFRDSEEVQAFYRKFKTLMEENDPNGKMQFIECIREYVKSQGNWAKVAGILYQSENTIRYRVNKVKAILGLEDNPVKFHELISLFAAIDEIINIK